MKQRKRPNQYSLKRIERLNAEIPERLKLIERCGGKPYFKKQTVKLNDGSTHIIERVFCVAGVCEICGKPATQFEPLEPHEYITKRSAGGKVALANSKMCHRSCHREQHSKPQFNWIKDGE